MDSKRKKELMDLALRLCFERGLTPRPELFYEFPELAEIIERIYTSAEQLQTAYDRLAIYAGHVFGLEE